MDRRENKCQKRLRTIPGVAYLVRLIVIAISWSCYSPEAVTILLICQAIRDILDAIVDADAVRPLIRELRGYFLRKWRQLKRHLSYIDIRIKVRVRIGRR